MNACAVCGRPCPPDDRLPYRGGVGHFACAAKAQLSRTRGGRLRVLAGRRGKWARS
jgi:recombinational DNA repair protein (RecF pathway)